MGDIARRITGTQLAIFASGALAGALLGGGAALLVRDYHADMLPGLPKAKVALPAASDALPALAQRGGQQTSCPDSIAIPATDAEDGKFKLVDSIAGQQPGDVRALIQVGREAAAAQRGHDAEVAFVMACRVGAQLDADPLALADAKHALAWHYGNAARDSVPKQRERLTQRARGLYADSLRTYTAQLGPQSEKAKFAQQALASLAAPRASEESSTAVALAQGPTLSGSSNTQMGGAPAADRPPRAAAPLPARSGVRPSFDCAKARSTPEKLICADPQLAQLDRELGRLHARAKSVAPDAATFKQHNDEQWRRREAMCRDRACLLAWYAQRRAELVDEIEAARGDGRELHARSR